MYSYIHETVVNSATHITYNYINSTVHGIIKSATYISIDINLSVHGIIIQSTTHIIVCLVEAQGADKIVSLTITALCILFGML